ncbi:MAG TPA: class I SAM-dependent methyltransferase [Jatrophihabitans sp.]|jgi:SAM-dependent methyltransferase|uniref:class I SAM-dependent DNA methyltransferase n=1 Tax=Jatrophihabitans sp. TaxID=1932789 RepID=UPI002DF77D1E|nr:class I SAM-dependent methyltransferase [Jatrophihabitans sp.]
MQGFDPWTAFGHDVAQRYDDDLRGDEAETVAFLAGLAGDRPALEFAIGTGRIALPLAAAGVRVDGIEVSPDMVDRLRAKPDGAGLDVAMGDMTTTSTGRVYGVVYLVFNTIANLLTQDDQVRCFDNAARHLEPGGVFVVECLVPGDVARPAGQYVDAEVVGVDHVVLDVCRYDPSTQILDENHVRISADGIRLAPIQQRLSYPSELDLMARLAGLRLRQRWGGWRGEPYDAAARRHVSVYEKAVASSESTARATTGTARPTSAESPGPTSTSAASTA